MTKIKTNQSIELATPRKAYRKMLAIERAIAELPGARKGDAGAPLNHNFGDGLYVRTIHMSKGDIFVSKLHKTNHPYFVTMGSCLVWDGEKSVAIKSPFSGFTEAGTKRVLFILEDCVWTTVHATKETDLEKIEDEIIAKDYDSLVEHIKEKQLCPGQHL